MVNLKLPFMASIYSGATDLLNTHYIQRGTEVSGGEITNSLRRGLKVHAPNSSFLLGVTFPT